MNILRDIDVFLLSLDGTPYRSGPPVWCAPSALRRLRALGKRLIFVTNNSSRTEREHRQKLTRMGLFEGDDRVYTSAMATASYLKERYFGQRVHLVATAAVREELARSGLVLDDASPDVCVLAYDTTLTFEKLRRLDFFLHRGKPFLATHSDDVCPTPDGTVPDVGSVLALLERSSGRTAAVVGRPYPYMGEALSRSTGVPRERMCMVGDSMSKDIRFANSCGMRSVLVSSGEMAGEIVVNSPDRPDCILKDLNALFGD